MEEQGELAGLDVSKPVWWLRVPEAAAGSDGRETGGRGGDRPVAAA